MLKVREAAPYGKLSKLKTKQSQRDLHFGEDVRGFIEAWHHVMGEPKTGLLFSADGVDPINHNNFAKYHIKPKAVKVCSSWNGCYSGRHGRARTKTSTFSLHTRIGFHRFRLMTTLTPTMPSANTTRDSDPSPPESVATGFFARMVSCYTYFSVFFH